MTRPSEFTRERILKTAARLFAERGYEATSIRTLAAKARVNQAAINYHFKTKDGLYREVLRTARMTNEANSGWLPPDDLFRQIAANRRNAAKSTGPTTNEGKQRSRCNCGA